MALPEHSTHFHIMAKPAGPSCNLGCTYCFYLEKERLYPDTPAWAMPDDLLASFIRQYIESQPGPEIQFSWQGGEPTTLGLDFFRKVVALQQEHGGGRTIHNAFQTNGVLLDDAWCAFFAEHRFLIGLSIDGPEALHDRYRRDKGGHPTFARVMRGLACLKRHGVEFNTLTCVQRDNAAHPLDVYRFLRNEGSGFIQFIPVIERAAANPAPGTLHLVAPEQAQARVTEWSVGPRAYGDFLCTVFDEWVRHDVARTFVQIFDIALEAWSGMPPSLCVFGETCGQAMALEHNGDLYACDHFVYPENRLGNILKTPLAELAASPAQRAFGLKKREALPGCCRACDVYFMCHGECPKHRFLKSPENEPGLNYLCEGYRHFFRHIDPYMRFMARELRAERPPANVMAYAAAEDLRARNKSNPGPNDLCTCGSGRKFKKCCGRQQGNPARP